MAAIKSADLFERMVPFLEKHGDEIVKKIQSIYLFEVKADKTSSPVFFTVDLKNGKGKSPPSTLSSPLTAADEIGKITKGKEGKPDTTFVMLDDDLLLLAAGKLNAQNAFMTVRS